MRKSTFSGLEPFLKPQLCVKTTELRSLGVRWGEHRTVASDLASAVESSVAPSRPLGISHL